jgi:hypothetical protein
LLQGTQNFSLGPVLNELGGEEKYLHRQSPSIFGKMFSTKQKEPNGGSSGLIELSVSRRKNPSGKVLPLGSIGDNVSANDPREEVKEMTGGIANWFSMGTSRNHDTHRNHFQPVSARNQVLPFINF